MIVIGITGGIGSGKSTVLGILEKEYDAYIMMADDIGSLAFEKGTETYYRMIDTFGDSIINNEGEIDKNVLGNILMADKEKLSLQNDIVHPFVIGRMKKKLDEYRHTDRLVVIETAILYEAGVDILCDEVWAVITDKRIRIDRLIKNRGYSMQKAEAFIKRQMSDEDYIEKADRIIYNNDDVETLRLNIANRFDEYNMEVL